MGVEDEEDEGFKFGVDSVVQELQLATANFVEVTSDILLESAGMKLLYLTFLISNFSYRLLQEMWFSVSSIKAKSINRRPRWRVMTDQQKPDCY